MIYLNMGSADGLAILSLGQKGCYPQQPLDFQLNMERIAEEMRSINISSEI